MLSQCPPAGTPAGSADEVSDAYFIYINLKGENSFSHLLSPSFCPSPHTWVVYQRSHRPSSGAGGLVQMLLSGRRDGDSRRQRQDQWWLISWQEDMVVSLDDWRSEMVDAANHQKHLLLLHFAVTDGGGTLEIRCPYIFPVVFDLHCLPHLLCSSKGSSHISSERHLSWPSMGSCSLFCKGYIPHSLRLAP